MIVVFDRSRGLVELWRGFSLSHSEDGMAGRPLPTEQEVRAWIREACR